MLAHQLEQRRHVADVPLERGSVRLDQLRELAGSRVQVDQHAVELPRIRGERVCDRGEVGQELLELDALIGDGRRHRA